MLDHANILKFYAWCSLLSLLLSTATLTHCR